MIKTAKALHKIRAGSEPAYSIVYTDTNGYQWYTNGAVAITNSPTPGIPYTVASRLYLGKDKNCTANFDKIYYVFAKEIGQRIIGNSDLYQYLAPFKKTEEPLLRFHLDGTVSVETEEIGLSYSEESFTVSHEITIDARYLDVLQPVEIYEMSNFPAICGTTKNGLSFMVAERKDK